MKMHAGAYSLPTITISISSHGKIHMYANCHVDFRLNSVVNAEYLALDLK